VKIVSRAAGFAVDTTRGSTATATPSASARTQPPDWNGPAVELALGVVACRGVEGTAQHFATTQVWTIRPPGGVAVVGARLISGSGHACWSFESPRPDSVHVALSVEVEVAWPHGFAFHADEAGSD
jgi:hypothetical protein